ncbi:hypothetical protein EXIGLDRAFT_721599 [Exidia glandulosa HHB12029]|uniref:Uncharacterized protein n=1 Tax=Exidia glandulosa HHB12029 TaxID=1314781 RepID=A0A165FLP9_EXIGL|nr:hypothetical protein EXIGLDRAFT_721599 [Exidia glandulosa HHB12029]
MYESVPIRRGLMLAYSTTRVAPDDSARHWDHLASLPVASLSARTIEHALASAPTLDDLNARWSHFETNAESKLTRPGQLSTLQTFYAQHLVRLGARDAAAKFVARYPAHAYVAWMFEPGELGNDSEDEEIEASTRRNREIVRDLHANGLDFQRVLFVMSPNSSFYRSR